MSGGAAPLFQQALQHHQAGRLAEAEAFYRQALAVEPDHVGSLHNLALLAYGVGQAAAALPLIERAVARDPSSAVLYNTRGLVLLALGRYAEAAAGFERAVMLKPGYVEAHNNLGVALRAAGRLAEAEEAHRRAVQLQPDYAEAFNNLGAVLEAMGRVEEAVEACRRAIEIRPAYPEAWFHLGVVLRTEGALEAAEQAYGRAIALAPSFAEAHNNLGVVLKALGRRAAAADCFRRAVELRPGMVDAHRSLGLLLQDEGRFAEAVAACERALALDPLLPAGHSTLASALMALGRQAEAEASYARAVELRPGLAEVESGLLFSLNYSADKSAEEIYAAYETYGARVGERPPAAKVGRSRRERLRVGYVSPDFRAHSARSFLEPVLEGHDRSRFEIFAYSEAAKEDGATARYKALADHWVPTRGLGDRALAERIASDGIDVLVDLAGHTAGNRLGVFAMRPAPVSATWLGTGYTTGLKAIDHILIDAVMAPEGSEALFSERPWRLAQSYVYRASAGMGEPGALPAQARGHVTFGVLTRAIRINARTVAAWAALLKRVEGSRLVVNSRDFKDRSMQDQLAGRFAEHGIGRERLEIGFESPPWEVLRGVDIGLDCFPHNSGTTLFESLYMGSPVVTLAGRPSVGRIGASTLTGLGRPEWISKSEAAYVEIAACLASDLPALAAIRAGLREEMERSALMDEAGFVRSLEAAYDAMAEAGR